MHTTHPYMVNCLFTDNGRSGTKYWIGMSPNAGIRCDDLYNSHIRIFQMTLTNYMYINYNIFVIINVNTIFCAIA